MQILLFDGNCHWDAPQGKMNYYYALVAAINDMESHGKSSDSTASSEAIDA